MIVLFLIAVGILAVAALVVLMAWPESMIPARRIEFLNPFLIYRAMRQSFKADPFDNFTS